MDAQRINRSLSHALAGNYFCHDCFVFTARAAVDRRGSPCSQALARQPTGRHAGQPALHELSHGDGLSKSLSLVRIVAGSSKQDAERSGGLCRKGHAAAIEPVPDNLHTILPVSCIAGRQEIGLVYFQRFKLQSVVVSVLEWMQSIAPQAKCIAVSIGQTHQHYNRLAFVTGQHFDKSAVCGASDKYLCARQQPAVFAAFQSGSNGIQIAPGPRLCGPENGERPTLGKSWKMPRLLRRRTKSRESGYRTDRRMHAQHASSRWLNSGNTSDYLR